MTISPLKLDGLFLISPKIFSDPRGCFLELYKQDLYQDFGLPHFVQDNFSFSKKNTLRGLHFQEIPEQEKLVIVLQGKIFDVTVDLRRNSKTFGLWEGVLLDDLSRQQLFIPKGFAHGFCVLSEMAHVLYKVSAPYNPHGEKGIFWNDPTLNISWHLQNPILSEKDKKNPLFKTLFPY